MLLGVAAAIGGWIKIWKLKMRDQVADTKCGLRLVAAGSWFFLKVAKIFQIHAIISCCYFSFVWPVYLVFQRVQLLKSRLVMQLRLTVAKHEWEFRWLSNWWLDITRLKSSCTTKTILFLIILTRVKTS